MTNARSKLGGLPVLNGVIDAELISLMGLKDKAAIDLGYVAFQLLHPLLDVQALAALIGEGLEVGAAGVSRSPSDAVAI